MAEKKMGAGLRGMVAGETALCTVGKEGTGLTYRGYDIEELAEKARFEEVAYLLLHGKLPKGNRTTVVPHWLGSQSVCRRFGRLRTCDGLEPPRTDDPVELVRGRDRHRTIGFI